MNKTKSYIYIIYFCFYIYVCLWLYLYLYLYLYLSLSIRLVNWTDPISIQKNKVKNNEGIKYDYNNENLKKKRKKVLIRYKS